MEAGDDTVEEHSERLEEGEVGGREDDAAEER